MAGYGYVEMRTSSPAEALRADLGEAERLVVNVNAENVEALLRLLDRIEARLDELEKGQSDVRAERGRWETLLARLARRPGPVAKAAARAGGMAKLRAANPPHESFWWRLDAESAALRRRAWTRLALALGGIVLFFVALYWAVETLFPPNPQVVLLSQTTAAIQERVLDGDFEGALAAAEASHDALADQPELLIWEAVLNEQLGRQERAAELLSSAEALLRDSPALYWTQLGTTRLQVGDLEGSEAAALQAAELDASLPQPYFLLANIADARGETERAIELFDKTFTLAEESDPQLAVIARVRVGELLQRPPAIPTPSSGAASPTP